MKQMLNRNITDHTFTQGASVMLLVNKLAVKRVKNFDIRQNPQTCPIFAPGNSADRKRATT